MRTRTAERKNLSKTKNPEYWLKSIVTEKEPTDIMRTCPLCNPLETGRLIDPNALCEAHRAQYKDAVLSRLTEELEPNSNRMLQ
jgi:hypothetical protein